MPKRLSRMHRRRWAIYVNALKRRYPLPFPVRIVTRNLHKDLDGDANFIDEKPRHYLIRVNNRGNFGDRRDTLAHEFAHLLADPGWNDLDNSDPIADHDEIWAVWQTRCERLLAETYEKLPDELKDKADRNANPEG